VTPADRLRAAADLIERTAAEVEVPQRWYNQIEGQLTQRHCPLPGADAAWIALVGPDTAPALAAWLRGDADAADMGQLDDSELAGWAPSAAALAFADLILRGQS